MKLQYCVNRTGAIPPEKLALTGLEVQTAAQTFHSTIPGYEATPLTSLDHLARRLGVSQVLVKDESKRFGLNAFKALGGSYAMARHLGEQLGLSQDQLTFEALETPEAREKLGERTFVTATDGNHGRGVAWAARQLGHRAVVYMPKGSARERLENIRAQGAQADEAGDRQQGAQVAQHVSVEKVEGGEGQADEHIGQGDPGQGALHRGGGGVGLFLLLGLFVLRPLTHGGPPSAGPGSQ